MANIIKNQGSQPARLTSVVDEMLKSTLTHFFNDEHWENNGQQRQHRVPVNINETDSSYELELIAPGGNKADFQLHVTNKVLSISYKPQNDQPQQSVSKRSIRKDFTLLPFQLSFTCDDSIDSDAVGARYENGVLMLTLPKRQDTKSLTQTIAIQ